MEKFEYQSIVFSTKGIRGEDADLSDLIADLNAQGDMGWELVNTVPTDVDFGSSRSILLIFKRKK